ncbi:hypothetical protein TNCV_2272741 [Trichonephila clavipes]|nr:hypothetical protein TNCV_2272741 [Trichonephila clavipes]
MECRGKWNRTLKDMLSKNVQEHGSVGISIFPCCYSHMGNTHSTTGMSPFQLVYGRFAFGTHISSQEVWVGERNMSSYSLRSVEKYLEDLIEKLRRLMK